jgi:DNA-binding LacI/PurR family transcriptional regulator
LRYAAHSLIVRDDFIATRVHALPDETMRKIKAESASCPIDQRSPGVPAGGAAPYPREGRRVTSYDVAMLAGVSQSAVSRCFKPGASVSKATYARVMKAAQGLDYIPNAAARSLITRRSNLVAVIISDMANLYYPEALSELSQQLTRLGKRVLLFTPPREANLDALLADVCQYQVDGVIAAVSLSAEQVAEFGRRGMPLVIFNRHVAGTTVHSVGCDQTDTARTLVSRLAEAGHRQFALIEGPDDSQVARERIRGARTRIAELGLPAPVVVAGDYDYASGGRGLREIVIRLGRLPDVIVCANDVMAIGCLDTARRELGIAVPAQMSVAGFDAVEPSTWLSYNLTTLRQPIRQMAAAAADMLARLIDGSDGNSSSSSSSSAGGSGDTGPRQRLFSAQFLEGATALLQAPAGTPLPTHARTAARDSVTPRRPAFTTPDRVRTLVE